MIRAKVTTLSRIRFPGVRTAFAVLPAIRCPNPFWSSLSIFYKFTEPSAVPRRKTHDLPSCQACSKAVFSLRWHELAGTVLWTLATPYRRCWLADQTGPP